MDSIGADLCRVTDQRVVRYAGVLNLSNGTTINAVLLSTLDVRKNKPGDRVIAKTTDDVKQDGQVVLHKGSRLIGHVTEAQAKRKPASRPVLSPNQ